MIFVKKLLVINTHMKSPGLFHNIASNLFSIYRGRNLLWQIIFVIITYGCVVSGFDWYYYESTRNVTLQGILFTAAFAGFFVPVFLPILLFIIGAVKKSARFVSAGWATIQAGILGLTVSTFYKIWTGRPGPHHILGTTDVSHIFQFGFLRGGSFQGWPSSHTSVAFAMSFALITLFPEKKWVKYVALAYAIYIGIGVSATIHWFSDFAAGAILGALIGVAVGRGFVENKARI